MRCIIDLSDAFPGPIYWVTTTGRCGRCVDTVSTSNILWRPQRVIGVECKRDGKGRQWPLVVWTTGRRRDRCGDTATIAVDWVTCDMHTHVGTTIKTPRPLLLFRSVATRLTAQHLISSRSSILVVFRGTSCAWLFPLCYLTPNYINIVHARVIRAMKYPATCRPSIYSTITWLIVLEHHSFDQWHFGSASKSVVERATVQVQYLCVCRNVQVCKRFL